MAGEGIQDPLHMCVDAEMHLPFEHEIRWLCIVDWLKTIPNIAWPNPRGRYVDDAQHFGIY